MIFFKRILFSILLFSSLFLSKIKAQDYVLNYEQLTTKQGLSNNFVTSIVQDKKGFMWFGTQDGLCRYDGNSYKTYKTNIEKNHILLSNNITSLALFNDSLLYIGTNAGLHIFNIVQNTITPIEALKNIYIHQIFIDNQNVIWIVNDEAGIYSKQTTEKKWHNLNNKYPELRNKEWVSVSQEVINKKAEIVLVSKEDFGNTLALTYVLYQLKKNSWQPIFHQPESYIDATHNGNLLITTKVMNYPYFPNSHKPLIDKQLSVKYLEASGKQERRLAHSLSAKKYQNKLYIPLAKSILIIDLTTYKVISEIKLSETTASQNNDIKDIFIDRDGNLWVATFGNGILIFPTYSVKAIRGYRYNKNDISKGLSTPSTRAIYKDSITQNLWIGTYSKKRIVDIFSNKNDKTTLPLYLSRAFLIKEDKKDKNTLWIATYSGIVKAKRNNPKFLKYYFRYYLMQTLEISSDTTILFTDTNYLYKFNTRKEETQKKIPLNKATYLYQDATNTVWIGTRTDGFASWNMITDEIIYYNPEEKAIVKSLHVKCIYEDTKGKLWIATTKGLYNFDKLTKKTQKFDTKHGLPHNLVYGILEDNHYNLWLSTNKGISKFNIEEKTFENFDVNDGLQDDEYNTYSFFKSATGELFFGGINGVDAFFPDDLKRNKQIPNLVLTGFKQLGKEIKTTVPIEEINKIILPIDSAQMLTFEFAALNFYQSKRNQYAYKIEEIDTTWIQLGNKNELTLTNLAAGNYTLRIKGSNNHGVWNEEGITLKINIIPPFWQQNWFFISLLFLFLGGVYVLYKVRIYQSRRREEKLESQIKERTRELATANRNKDKLFAIIAHDLRSPLTAFEDVSNQIEYFLRKNKPDRLLQLGKHIDTSIQGLNILLNNLLGWALIQQNHKIKVNPQKIDLSEMVERMLSIYENVAQSNQINLKNFVKDNIEITVDIDSFQTILRNLISNALKYTPTNGTVILQTLQEKESVTLVIQDTGIGMKQEMIETLFQSNSIQSNRGIRGEKGTGLGLALCQEFATLNHIKIEVESQPNEGTIFYLTIPTS